MKKYDASIVLNLHREGPFLKRTLISLDHAVKLARDEGHTFQLVAVLDRADDMTRKVMQEHDCSTYSASKIIEVDNGSLGLSRNDGVAACDGEYIYTADGDDLISENFFKDFIHYYKKEPEICMYFPEYVIAFGDDYFYTRYNDLSVITPFTLINNHPYISRVCAHHSLFDLVKYQDTRLREGYAYEDWLFNCDVIANGIDVKIVPDTALYYRQRSGSLLRQSNSISTKQIPPSKLFHPETYVQIGQKYISSNKNAVSDRLHEGAIHTNHKIIEYTDKASAIEPEINIGKYKNSLQNNTKGLPTHVGEAYFYISNLIKNQKFDDVFLFPFLSKGGAEKYTSEIINSFARIYPERNILILLGEGEKVNSQKKSLPLNTTCIDLHLYSSFLSSDDREIITIKILQTCANSARIHYRQSVFSDQFIDKYSVIFQNNKQVYYRFIEKTPLKLISNNIDYITDIVTDNESLIEHDVKILGNLHHDKWKFLPAPIDVQKCEPDGSKASKKLLWASRLDQQKRPQLLLRIHDKLLSNESIKIDVYGDSVFGEFSPEKFENHKNLSYLGSFNGLNSLNLQEYGIFLYTSYYDGLPNILLEAMAAGLLVIAPNVGGISEIVRHKETGYLIEHTNDDEKMAESYAAAIKEILAAPEQIETMTKNATRLLQERHSYEKYDQHIRELFGTNESQAQKEREQNNFDITNPETANSLMIDRLKRQRDIALFEAEAATRMLHNNPTDFISYGKMHNSKAYRLADLYTRTAHGPNFVVKFWRFGQALYPIGKRMVKRKLFNR